METGPPEVRTYFYLEGDELDPDEFTQLVGVQPTKTTRKGELSPYPILRKQGRTAPSTLWDLNVTENSYNIDDVIKKLLGRVWHRRDAILEYVRNKPSVTVGILTAVTIYDDRPIYELSVDTIKKLAYLGAEWGMDDIYDHRNEPPTQKT